MAGSYIADVTHVPALTGAPGAQFPIERRDLARRAALGARILAEFTEMPGLTLTLTQAARLFGITAEACGRILMEHVRGGRLELTDAQRYALAADSQTH